MLAEKLLNMSLKHQRSDCVMCKLIKKKWCIFFFMFLFFYQARFQVYFFHLVQPWDHPTNERNFIKFKQFLINVLIETFWVFTNIFSYLLCKDLFLFYFILCISLLGPEARLQPLDACKVDSSISLPGVGTLTA